MGKQGSDNQSSTVVVYCMLITIISPVSYDKRKIIVTVSVKTLHVSTLYIRSSTKMNVNTHSFAYVQLLYTKM